MTKRLGRRLAGAVVALVFVFSLLFMPVGVRAQDASIVIPLPTVVHAPPGSEELLASQEIPADLVGMSCSARAIAENQSSVHPGNDLVVASGGQEIVLEDVERAPGIETTAEGTLTLATEVTVTLVMGEDGTFSAGMSVELTCPPASTTTSTSAPTTTMPDTTSSSVLATTITTSPPTTEPSTTMPETTSTSVLATTITSAPDTTSPPDTQAEATSTSQGPSPSTLPFTGVGVGTSAGMGAMAIVAGTGLLLLSRKPSGSERDRETETVVDVEGVRVRLLHTDD